MNELLATLDKAIRQVFGEWFHPVAHADTVVQVIPIWASARTLRAICGINRDQLKRLVIAGKVVAKPLDGNVVFKVSDVLSVIDSLPNKK